MGIPKRPLSDQAVSRPVEAVNAPTPPAGPTTYTALTGMVVGVIIAVLSLFDVVPSGEDVQALGTITGAAIAAIAFVVSAISRTKQANHLAKIAQAERQAVRTENPQVLVAGSRGGHVGTFSEPLRRRVTGRVTGDDAEPSLPSAAEVTAWGPPEPAVLGAPTDLSREVQFGSVRPPGVDVGGEAPEPAVGADAAYREAGVTPPPRYAEDVKGGETT